MPDSPGRHCERGRWHYLRCRLSLAQLRRIKDWQTAHRVQQPIECWAWETVMTIWVIALIGWLPAYMFETPWLYPACALGAFTPRLYLQLRADAQTAGCLRCDWLDLLADSKQASTD
jgi:hypothetical protein